MADPALFAPPFTDAEQAECRATLLALPLVSLAVPLLFGLILAVVP